MLSIFLPLFLGLYGVATASTSASQSQIFVPPCKDIKEFAQWIDHTGAATEPGSNGTFSQRYQLDTSHYKPGGPILFYQGNEGVSMGCIEYLILPTWAEELGAAVATLEHRFFGTSIPSNATDPVTRFETLTLDNILADSANFIDFVKCSLQGGKDSKVIAQGASYGATLSTLLRQNHPEAFWGAISSSPALRSLNPPPGDPSVYGYTSFQSMIYSYQSSEAAERIKNALLAFQERITTKEGLAGLQSDYNLCTAVNSSSAVSTLASFIVTSYEVATKFNYGAVQRSIGNSSIVVGYPFPDPLPLLINRTLSVPANDSTAVLNASLSLYTEQFGPCVDLSMDFFPAIETSVFNYITCALVSTTQASLPGGMVPPEPAANVSEASAAHCKETYNVTRWTQGALQTKYKFTQEDIQNATRLLIVAHEYDPVTANGPAPWSPGPNPSESRVQFIGEAGHCEDTYSPQEGDRDTVVQARAHQLEIIKSWLNDDV